MLNNPNISPFTNPHDNPKVDPIINSEFFKIQIEIICLDE